jgi:hypothetical protein
MSSAENDFDTWITHGIEAGYCGPPVCYTHDGIPTTAAEDEDDEPCLHVIRLYPDEETRAGVEENHSPTIWRNYYSTNTQT